MRSGIEWMSDHRIRLHTFLEKKTLKLIESHALPEEKQNGLYKSQFLMLLPQN